MMSLLGLLALFFSVLGVPADSADCLDLDAQLCSAPVDTSSGSADCNQLDGTKRISNGF